MKAIQASACRFSGVSMEEAFVIDKAEPSLYVRLGHPALVALSTRFYDAVYAEDPAGEFAWFRAIFAGSDKAAAIRNQHEFLTQRLGGPSFFSDRKGHPALIGRHMGFGGEGVSHRAAVRWLHHMEAALNHCAAEGGEGGESTVIDEDSRARLLAFFRHTAYFLVAGVGAARERQRAAGQRKPAGRATMMVTAGGVRTEQFVWARDIGRAVAVGLASSFAGWQLGEFGVVRRRTGLARGALGLWCSVTGVATFLVCSCVARLLRRQQQQHGAGFVLRATMSRWVVGAGALLLILVLAALVAA